MIFFSKRLRFYWFSVRILPIFPVCVGHRLISEIALVLAECIVNRLKAVYFMVIIFVVWQLKE